jgi:hypothetical protein
MMTDPRPSPYRSRASPRHPRPAARLSSRPSRLRRRNRLTETEASIEVMGPTSAFV